MTSDRQLLDRLYDDLLVYETRMSLSENDKLIIQSLMITILMNTSWSELEEAVFDFKKLFPVEEKFINELYLQFKTF